MDAAVIGERITKEKEKKRRGNTRATRREADHDEVEERVADSRSRGAVWFC